MISAVAILMLCNGIRISLKSEKYNQRNRVCHGVHDTPFSFLHFFVSSFFRFFIFSFLHFFHRISRMNRRHSCLSDYSRNFAELWPLANGSRPIYAPVVFCHADFADDADFSSCGLFCHADFAGDADFSLWRLFRPTDFTDIHRFFFVGLFPTSGGICTDRTGRLRENPCVIASPGNPPNKFRVIR